jgi:hypothetical protein
MAMFVRRSSWGVLIAAHRLAIDRVRELSA